LSSSRTAALLPNGTSSVSAENDPRLERLIESGGAEPELERLLADVAAPVIRRVVARHYRAGDATCDTGDLASAINLRLLHKLRRVPSSPSEAIEDLDNYVATLSYNVVNDYLRRRFPERARLKNRLRYTLTHDPRLALWYTRVGFAAGLREWKGSRDAAASTLDPARATRAMRDRERPADALQAAFAAAGGPVDFETLIDYAAELWGVADNAPVELDGIAGDLRAAPLQLERRELLGSLWREISDLRPMQRKALLLNLRDDEAGNVLALLVLTGIARFDEIAAALELPGAALADLWNELPLDDLRLASLLGVTRQQVINLRKSARERLRRRVR
jgi:hypothetical protein